VHGQSQAIQKRRRPQQLLTDNGSAMKDGEVREGLARLGILHERTLPACPEQNGKQEAWWNSVEGRLLAMLEGVERLTLDALNHATQAWVEMEYNRARNSETGEAATPDPELRRQLPRADPRTTAGERCDSSLGARDLARLCYGDEHLRHPSVWRPAVAAARGRDFWAYGGRKSRA
jgi:hypothetical protein